MENFLKIQITPAKNGIKVVVGCHEFVYQQENLEKFCRDLFLYLTDPEDTRKLIFKRWGITAEADHDQPDAPITRANRIVDASEEVELRAKKRHERAEELREEETKEVRETTQKEGENPGPTQERSR